MKKILFIGGSDFYPSDRFRIIQYLTYLEAKGIKCDFICPKPSTYYRPEKKNKYVYWFKIRLTILFRKIYFDSLFLFKYYLNDYQTIFVNRHIYTNKKLHFIERIVLSSGKLIFDFDDAIYLNQFIKNKVDIFIKSSKIVFAGNNILANYAKLTNKNVKIVPTTIDTAKYKQKVYEGHKRPMVVGWMGSYDAMRFSLPVLSNVLLSIFRLKEFELLIVSDKIPDEKIQIRIPFTFKKWEESLESSYIEKMDIGLMPLTDEPFQYGKCGAKLLQYMATGIVSVASPYGVNSQIVHHGINGFLAETEDEWISILTHILHMDINEMTNLGANARTTVENKYSINSILPTIIEDL